MRRARRKLSFNRFPKGRVHQYRSQFERSIAQRLAMYRCNFGYETMELPYTTQAKYKPDFILPNGVIVEAKGWFKPSDRAKMLAVKKSHPQADIRLLFQNSKVCISKASLTTYGEWADKHGFKWASGNIPQEWVNEPPRRQESSASRAGEPF